MPGDQQTASMILDVDLDGDGDLDLISVGWYNPKIWFYENKAIPAGIVKQQ